MRTWRALLAAGSLVTLLVLLTLVNAGSRPASANPIGGLTAISAGDSETCAVTTAGGVKCWGLVTSEIISALPVDMPGLSAGIVEVSVRGYTACARSDAGSVSCWSEGQAGAFGNYVPMPVTGLPGPATHVSVGNQHACALIEGGSVTCWGGNSDGELGNGTTFGSATPVAVPGITDAVSVDVGYYHSCAVTAAGGVECWGQNDTGQLGDGTDITRLRPVAVSGLDSGAVAVAGAMNFTCASMAAGTVKCWGVGYGPSPVDLPGIDDAVAIDAGTTHACALTRSDGVRCWGTNGLGELGDAMACGSRCATPVDVSGLSSGVAAISAGAFSTCALLTDGGMKCWGDNGWGHLGDGDGATSDAFSAVPVDVVERTEKPTPTPTPCPPAGCPTPTPRPLPPQTGLDFSIAIDANGDGVPECSTKVAMPAQCSLPPGTRFRVIASLDSFPPGVTGWGGFDTDLQFAGVESQQSWNFLWPDCGFPAEESYSGELFFGCARGLGASPSPYAGPLVSADFTCTRNGSVTLGHDATARTNASDLVDDDLREYVEPGAPETLVVNCGPIERGDTNCNTAVDAIDAAVTLQYDARLIDHVGCPQQSDVNLDSVTNAVDALLTKQYDAALVPFLPPQQLRR